MSDKNIMETPQNIRAIIGLGNPGPRFSFTRHNAGFLVLDELAERHHGSWQHKDSFEFCELMLGDTKVILIKPQTFMNESGKVMPFLHKKGIKPEELLVVHDELEKPFGKIAFKKGGSHRGHNGLRSIIGACGPDFHRLRFGIGRPEKKEDVSDYVLAPFDVPRDQVVEKINDAVAMIEGLFY